MFISAECLSLYPKVEGRELTGNGWAFEISKSIPSDTPPTWAHLLILPKQSHLLRIKYLNLFYSGHFHSSNPEDTTNSMTSLSVTERRHPLYQSTIIFSHDTIILGMASSSFYHVHHDIMVPCHPSFDIIISIVTSSSQLMLSEHLPHVLYTSQSVSQSVKQTTEKSEGHRM